MNQPHPQVVTLNSTPSSRDTASRSEFPSSILYVDRVMPVPRHTTHSLRREGEVSPSILVDLESHSTCSFEAFLEAFLVFCLDGKNAPPNLLQRCLDAVLPIYNAHLKSNKGNKRTKGKGHDYGADIHNHLTDLYVSAFSSELFF